MAVVSSTRGAKSAARPATVAFKHINALFTLERDLKELNVGERYTKHLALSQLIVDQFYEWLAFQRPRVLPKRAFGEAIAYCFNQKENYIIFYITIALNLITTRLSDSLIRS